MFLSFLRSGRHVQTHVLFLLWGIRLFRTNKCRAFLIVFTILRGVFLRLMIMAVSHADNPFSLKLGFIF
jgi:hypothetical protein